MHATHVTLVGNLVDNPELRLTPTGSSTTSFRLACTERVWSSAEGRYVDGRTSFYRISCWDYLAANAAAALHRGQRIIVTGKLELQEYETRDGLKRIAAVVTADALGHDLQFGTTLFSRVVRSSTSAAATPAEDGADPEFVEVDGMRVGPDGEIIATPVDDNQPTQDVADPALV